MQYMFLIYSADGAVPKPGTAEHGDMMRRYIALNAEVRDNGTLRDSAPLQGIDTATTVRVRDGQTEVTDGPFAETKELLGGFFIVDCEDLDAALAFAARIPTAEHGSIEVRPVAMVEGINAG